MKPDRFHRASLWLSVAAALAGAGLGGASASHIDILWDEQVDHDIAAGLRADPLFGEQPTLDPSQFRLPMYANAAVFALSGRDDLAVSRGVSLVCGAVTVVTAAALARLLFGPVAALLTAVLLAFSPYFLAFARIAMTEGDIFLACFVTLAVLGFIRFLRAPSPGRWLLAAVLLALAVGAKLFSVFLIPVFVVLARSTRSPAPPESAASDGAGRPLGRLLAAQIGILLITGLLAWIHRRPSDLGLGMSAAHAAGTASVAGWAILLCLWVGTCLHVLRRRVLAASRTARVLGLITFAACTFFALMPVHLLEHRIAREIAHRVLTWDHRFPLALWQDHLRLYSGIVWLKLPLPWGLLTTGAILWAMIREREDWRWRPCILALCLYVAALCSLPLRQSFYLVGVYPLLMILTAGALSEIGRRLRGRRLAFGALATAAGLGFLGAEDWRAYPNYQLYGAALTGDHWLGAESRGYRNLIQTPSDGVASLIRWCVTSPRVRPGDHIVSYLWEQRIIDRLLPADRSFVFVPRGVTSASDTVPPPPALDDADFVLVHINNLLGYGDRPPDRPPANVLASRFEPVFTVRRGPIEVAWVYARRRPG